ncbi:glycosyl transferase group 1 [Nitrosococcus halophilus Nc 4]|uniref:Glycosyl transferase group 1 n=1 Tax=Nitrosococcus halophilus (strain Nc4) TaxID=472759 RepID=D5BZD8_NITHN|nr:glycosyltransferase [Nitrosococcus halophilus]ADE16152.1 glycosyl transferase group 1 [Nitrosococcus halophilus Nc 4]
MLLRDYAEITGEDVIDQLRQLAEPLRGMKVVHVNSTRLGGGVAEILTKLVPLMRELEIDTHWEVITGESAFYDCTKAFHNALQGNRIAVREDLLRTYERTTAENAERLRPLLEEADYVFIHDPQPAPLLGYCPHRKGKWIWRCHIDISHPYRPIWRYLRKYIEPYESSVFSLSAFAQALPHTEYIIPPSIDPLSEKNIDLEPSEVAAVRQRFGLDPSRPLLVQISRFDRFKDPLGVIRAYQLARKFLPQLQLVLAGGGASDDPEGRIVLEEVQLAAAEDPDIHILLLPPDSHRIINALQRAADIVLQKSLREGFGLTVTEALWKAKPVIGGDTGGIRLQVTNHHTGFLVSTPEGAALRIRYLLHQPRKMAEMAVKSREFVRDNFLITRQLREYLTLMVALLHGKEDRIILE